VRRTSNNNLSTLGELLAPQGVVPMFIYGGYGYFDNMNSYFRGNDYLIVDRTDFPKDSIVFENVWGVADEVLYANALRALNEKAAAGKPFFRPDHDHVEPPALHLPGRAHRHSFSGRQAWRREIHRLGDRRVHPRGEEAAMVRRHAVRVRRRSLRVGRRPDASAGFQIPDPVDLLCAAYAANRANIRSVSARSIWRRR
jgi:hypothetical protein